MAYNNIPVRNRSKAVVFTEEIIPGTPVLPTSSNSQTLPCEEISDMSQDPVKVTISEFSAEILRNDEKEIGKDFASPKINIIPRLGISAGTAPPENILLESFFGNKTDISSKSNTYTFLNKINTLSAWLLTEDKFLDIAAGLAIDQMSIKFSADDVLKYEFSCKSNQIIESAVSVIPPGTIQITSGSSKTIATSASPASSQFFVGQKIGVYDSENTNTLTDTLTLTAVSGSDGTITSDVTSTLKENYELRPIVTSAAISNTGGTLSAKSTSIYLDSENTADGSSSGQIFENNNLFIVNELSLDLNKNLQTPEKKFFEWSEISNSKLYSWRSY